jgi:single-stranded DNA-binding protein
MTIFRLAFAGHIKKAEHKTISGKTLVELSLCRKNKTKEGEPDAYTWARIALWEPDAFMVPKLIKGAYISGSGDMLLRSYVNKDGANAQSLDVRCGSFDVDMPDERQQAHGDSPPPPARPSAPASGGVSGDDQPPFARRWELE